MTGGVTSAAGSNTCGGSATPALGVISAAADTSCEASGQLRPTLHTRPATPPARLPGHVNSAAASRHGSTTATVRVTGVATLPALSLVLYVILYGAPGFVTTEVSIPSSQGH